MKFIWRIYYFIKEKLFMRKFPKNYTGMGKSGTVIKHCRINGKNYDTLKFFLKRDRKLRGK
jgi:hypothetical protein